MKKLSSKTLTILLVAGLLSIALISQPTSGLISQNMTSWFWNSDTNVAAVQTGDVNADGISEIVTVGYYNNGVNWNAQLAIWNAATLAAINIKTWAWTSDTQISSVAIGDVNGDSKMEIVTGGSYFDGTRWVAQLAVWDGATLALDSVQTWYWSGDTQISSVALANITGTTGLSIITGGSYFDGTRWVAQLVTWSGVNLAVQNVVTWYWGSHTFINSVAFATIGTTPSIITGGAYFDGTRYNAQLVSWNAASMAFQNVQTWYWIGDTEINSVAILNSGTTPSIITGGYYFDGTRNNAQLASWNSATFALQNVASYFWTSNTGISSVAVANITGGANLDIITGGYYNDNLRNNAQIVNWNSATFAVNSIATWFSTAGTSCNSVAVGNFGLGNRTVAGGSFFDGTRSNAQLSIWT